MRSTTSNQLKHCLFFLRSHFSPTDQFKVSQSKSLQQHAYKPKKINLICCCFSVNHGFSGFRPPLTGEEALWRELEKEVIRREILRRMELEEEVRRELAIERELGISTQRPLNIQGLLSQWSNSTQMNPAVGHIGASQPQLILSPTAINPSPEISDKDKVIVLVSFHNFFHLIISMLAILVSLI